MFALYKNNIKNKFNKNLKLYFKYKYLTLLLVPALLYYVVFHYVPIYGVQIAFKAYRISEGIRGSEWVGLENFKDLFMVPSFWEVLRNTIILSIYKMIFVFTAPIVFALLLNEIRHLRYKKMVQTISYLPHFMSWVILGGLFMQFLSPSTGPVNVILKSMGFSQIYFMADPSWFRTVLVSTSIWKGIGWGSIIYLAALAGINPELYQAAIVDGANRFQRIMRITIPSLTPVLTIMFIFEVGKLITDDFDQIFNMYNPAVYSVADVLSTYTYRMGIGNMKYSFATAVGLFKNIIAFSLVITMNKIAKKVNDYGIW